MLVNNVGAFAPHRPAASEDLLQAPFFFLDEDSGENVEVDGGWLPEKV